MEEAESELPLTALSEPLFGREKNRKFWPRLAIVMIASLVLMFGFWALPRWRAENSREAERARGFLRENKRLARFLGAPIQVIPRPLRFRYHTGRCRFVFRVKGPRRSGEVSVDVDTAKDGTVLAAEFEAWNLLMNAPMNRRPQKSQ